MSSGKTHEKLNIVFFIILMYLGLGTILYSVYGFFGILLAFELAVGYWVGTYFMNPDLDIRSRPYNRWKWFRFIWIPYRKLGHRSIWTHGIIIGDIIRYAYLLGLISLVYWGVALLLNFDAISHFMAIKTFVFEYKTHFIAFFVGNCLSSFAHILADHTSTGIKKMFK